jgi:hypothetical protein
MSRARLPWLAALAALLLAESATAETRVRTKLYFCRRADSPPVLDGVLNDPCWQKACVMEDFGFMDIGDQKGPAPKTLVRVLYDNDRIYFGFDCKEPLMDKFRQAIKGSNIIFWKDCLEWYIDTQNDDKGYCALWANAVGESFSERRINMDWAIVTDLSFRLWARWRYVPRMNDDGWVVEAEVSMKDLNVPPREGHIMGFNPCRFRLIVSPGQFLCWSTVGGRQKNPALYGHMVLGDPPRNIEDVLKVIYPAHRQMTIEIPKGDSMDVYKAGKVSVVRFKDIVAQRIQESSGSVESVEKELNALPKEALPKDTQKTLDGVRARFEKVRAELEASAELKESDCLRLLAELEDAGKSLEALMWDVKTSAVVEEFRARLAKRPP